MISFFSPRHFFPGGMTRNFIQSLATAFDQSGYWQDAVFHGRLLYCSFYPSSPGLSILFPNSNEEFPLSVGLYSAAQLPFDRFKKAGSCRFLQRYLLLPSAPFHALWFGFSSQKWHFNIFFPHRSSGCWPFHKRDINLIRVSYCSCQRRNLTLSSRIRFLFYFFFLYFHNRNDFPFLDFFIWTTEMVFLSFSPSFNQGPKQSLRELFPFFNRSFLASPHQKPLFLSSLFGFPHICNISPLGGRPACFLFSLHSTSFRLSISAPNLAFKLDHGFSIFLLF